MSNVIEPVKGNSGKLVEGRKTIRPWRVNVLDHGYVALIESWGSDQGIIEAARMSTDKGFLGWGPRHLPSCPSQIPEGKAVEVWPCETLWSGHGCPGALPESRPADHVCADMPRLVGQGPCSCDPKPGDEKLLAYLWKKQHTTPFEMAGLKIEVQAPLLVFREWHRHRTQSYSELSARYTQMPDLHYVPSLERMKQVAGTNKQAQAQGTAPLATDIDLGEWVKDLRVLQKLTYRHYEDGLRLGIPKEVARLNMPVSRYSRMQVSANLWNWLRFLRLRLAPDAQWEIREFAKAVAFFIAYDFPRTWALFQLDQPGLPVELP